MDVIMWIMLGLIIGFCVGVFAGFSSDFEQKLRFEEIIFLQNRTKELIKELREYKYSSIAQR